MSPTTQTSPSSATRRDYRAGRTYTLPDGSEVPSVTTILTVIGKPALINWAANVERELVIEAAANLYEDAPLAAKMSRAAYIATLQARIGKDKAHQRQSEKALEIGSAVHKLVEWNLKGELGQERGTQPRLPAAAASAFEQYEAWRAKADLKPARMEQTVWHEGERYAGTLDVLGQLAGKLTVLDFKTSKGIYLEHELQVAAYAYAVNFMHHGPVVQAAIVKLPKQEGQGFEVRVLDMKTLDSRYDAFLEAKRLWLHVRQWEQQQGFGNSNGAPVHHTSEEAAATEREAGA